MTIEDDCVELILWNFRERFYHPSEIELNYQRTERSFKRREKVDDLFTECPLACFKELGYFVKPANYEYLLKNGCADEQAVISVEESRSIKAISYLHYLELNDQKKKVQKADPEGFTRLVQMREEVIGSTGMSGLIAGFVDRSIGPLLSKKRMTTLFFVTHLALKVQNKRRGFNDDSFFGTLEEVGEELGVILSKKHPLRFWYDDTCPPLRESQLRAVFFNAFNLITERETSPVLGEYVNLRLSDYNDIMSTLAPYITDINQLNRQSQG